MSKPYAAEAQFAPDGLDRDRMFKGEPQPYLWCLHCERAYERGYFRSQGGLQMCPYGDCDGDAAIDAWGWEAVREGNHSYPEVPKLGAVYPLYGTGDGSI